MLEQIKAILLRFKGWLSRPFTNVDPEMDDIVLATSFQEMLDDEQRVSHDS